MTASLTNSTVAELVQRLGAGEVTSAEVTGAYLDRIAAEDGELGSYLHVDPDAALARAGKVDAARTEGSASPVVSSPEAIATRTLDAICA